MTDIQVLTEQLSTRDSLKDDIYELAKDIDQAVRDNNMHHLTWLTDQMLEKIADLKGIMI